MRHRFTLGQQIGHWTIIGLPDGEPEHKNKIRCRCVCGTIRWIYRQTLTNGTSRSCGCRRHERANAQQIAGKEKGKRVISSIHQAHLAPKYAGFGRKVNRNSTTGVPGVSLIPTSSKSAPPRYRAQINVNGKQSIWDVSKVSKTPNRPERPPSSIISKKRRKKQPTSKRTRKEISHDTYSSKPYPGPRHPGR